MTQEPNHQKAAEETVCEKRGWHFWLRTKVANNEWQKIVCADCEESKDIFI